MPAKNRSIPNATVMPVLAYSDVRAAVAWLCRVFGFRERLQIAEHRSQLLFEDGALVVKEGSTKSAPRDSVLVRVANVDAHYERSKKADAKIVSPPTDYPFGERQYSVEDLEGRSWTFSQTIADANPGDWGGVLREP